MFINPARRNSVSWEESAPTSQPRRTGGAFTLVDERANRGMSVPLHLHRDDMESFYVLEGEIAFYIGDQPGVRAGAGSFAHLPGGTIHGFRIES
jgi:quercetin dioxygenase-like cupin family protein